MNLNFSANFGIFVAEMTFLIFPIKIYRKQQNRSFNERSAFWLVWHSGWSYCEKGRGLVVIKVNITHVFMITFIQKFSMTIQLGI